VNSDDEERSLSGDCDENSGARHKAEQARHKAEAQAETACYNRYLENCRIKGIALGWRCCACDDRSGNPCGDATSEEREERCGDATSAEREEQCNLLDDEAVEAKHEEHCAQCELLRVEHDLQDDSQYRDERNDENSGDSGEDDDDEGPALSKEAARRMDGLPIDLELRGQQVASANLQDNPQHRDERKAALRRSIRKSRHASYPDIDVAKRNAITVREEIERANGRHYNDLQREAEYDSFFDYWYHHWPDDDNGKPMTFEYWFDNTIFTAPGRKRTESIERGSPSVNVRTACSRPGGRT
jgi:hypothetical protein